MESALAPREKGGNSRNAQKAALDAWAKSLSENDYNATEWARTMRRQPQNFFDEYLRRMNEIFKQNSAAINFILVGACDGLDGTVKNFFIPNSHWNAAFVEPMSNNFRDLTAFLKENGVADRSYAINAAATDVCTTVNVTVKNPIGFKVKYSS